MMTNAVKTTQEIIREFRIFLWNKVSLEINRFLKDLIESMKCLGEFSYAGILSFNRAKKTMNWTEHAI